jgi:hypothetical protein
MSGKECCLRGYLVGEGGTAKPIGAARCDLWPGGGVAVHGGQLRQTMVAGRRGI